MAYRAARIDRILFVRWLSTPTLPDLTTLLREVSTARRTLTGPMGYCTVIDAGSGDPPSGEVRDAMLRNVGQVLMYCDAIDAVVPGDGIDAKLVRTFWRGFITATGTRGRFFVHSTLEEALGRMREPLGIDPSAVAREARMLGLAD